VKDAMTPEPHGVHFASARLIRALRILVLVALAGVTLALAMTYGRRDEPQTEITMSPLTQEPAAEGPVIDQAETFEISGTREGRAAFVLRARTVTGFAGERKLLDGVHLTVYDEEGRATQITARTGQFDPAARRAQLTGDVAIESATGLSLLTDVLFYDSERDMIFTADPIVFGLNGLSGEGRGLNYQVRERRIKIPDRVSLWTTGPKGTTPTRITSGDLVTWLDDHTAVFTGDVKLTRGAEVLRGNYLKLWFDEDRSNVNALSAFGDVIASLTPGADGLMSELRSDSLTARFSSPAETIEEAEASGDCRVSSGPYTSRSRSARYRRSADTLELRGDPVVLSDRDRIAAQEIDLHPEQDVLEARGDVRTVSLPHAERDAAGVPGFGSGSALSFQASTLRADRADQRITYSGSARAWQEGHSIQADTIVLDEARRQLRATGKVMSRFTQPAGPGGRSAAPIVTAITAHSVVLDDALGAASYRDLVTLTRLDARLTADAMDAHLVDRGERRELDHVEARDSVAVKRGDTFGTAQRASYLSREGLLVLQDEAGLAEVVDTATGRTMRGRTLTFDLAGDRILTETAGGRTWITLTPESKDVPSVESQTRH
jgi:LPS export ABC transporter protein LptC